jgi:hypothetical protein
MVDGLAAKFLAEVDEWHKERVVRPAVARQTALARDLQPLRSAASRPRRRALRRWVGERLMDLGAWLSGGPEGRSLPQR